MFRSANRIVNYHYTKKKKRNKSKCDIFIIFDTKILTYSFISLIIRDKGGIYMYSDILSNLIITKVYSVTTLYSEMDMKIKRNDRSCWAIVIKYEGETTYTSGKNFYRSDIHNLVILPKGCSYEWHCTHPGHYSIIEFESDLVCNGLFTFSVGNSEKILKLFKEME